ncbi:MAG TPA: AsmA-like C-terminal region-containing protein [Anaeromyxobacteraceae bacterium]|nr:AsmA-like C-terminal region-containing protein [Anaeromyxobacteraceae bacterium]
MPDAALSLPPTPARRRRWPKVALAVAGVLLVLAAAGLLVLDSFLTSRARREAAELSQRLGRTVEVGGVATKVLGGLGVRVSDLRVGPAAGEDLPLLEVRRIEVKASLLRALLSRGKDVVVRSAEVEGMRVNVLRLPEGSTNVERLQRSLAGEGISPEGKAPAAPGQAPTSGPAAAPPDLSLVTVERATLVGGRIAFVDRTHPGSRELFVDQIDLSIADLASGRPAEVRLKAAVLAARPNLEVRLRTAPLSPMLRPMLESVSLKVEPVDLAPLAPFVPKGAGFRSGRVEAALEASLGAALPGGTGPTRVKGGFKAIGLVFQGGEALDASLDADVTGDAGKGDLSISKLDLSLGPASLKGRGRVSGLAAGSPKVEGLEIASRNLDLARLEDFYPPLGRALGGRVSGPVGLSLHGTGTEARQALELKVDLTPVRLDFPGTLAKAAGGKMVLSARLKGAAVAGGALAFDAEADLAGLDLRPGGQVTKAPGERLRLSLAGKRRAAGDEETVEIDSAELLLPQDSLAARATVTRGGGPGKVFTRFEARAESARLDLDRLLLPAPRGKQAPLGAAKPGRPSGAGAYAGLSGEARVHVGLLKARKAEARDVTAVIRVKGDEVVVEKGEASAFGGSLSADGTRVRLASPDEPFQAKLTVRNVDVQQALLPFTDKKILSGRFDGVVDLGGGGLGKPDLGRTLAGLLSGKLQDATFHGKDLVAAAAGPLARALPFGLAGKEGKGGATSLGKEQPFEVEFKDGFARLKKPITVSRPEADVDVTGGFRVDGTVDMPVTVALSPQTVAGITGGKARPSAPVPVTFRLTGPAWSPSVSGLELKPAVHAIVQEAGSAALGKALGVSGDHASQKDLEKKATDEAKKRLQGLFKR